MGAPGKKMGHSPASFTRSRLRRTASLGIPAARPALLRTASPGAGKHRSGAGRSQAKPFAAAEPAWLASKPAPGPKQIKPARGRSRQIGC
jgi:hypothetical protein